MRRFENDSIKSWNAIYKIFRKKSILNSLKIFVKFECQKTRIYSTLIENLYYIENSNSKKQIEIQNLRLKKHFENFVLLMSMREKIVIEQNSLIFEFHLIMKIVKNQNQIKDEIFDEINFNFSKFKRERNALIQNNENEHVIEFVIGVIYENEIIEYLIKYTNNDSFLINF